MKKKDRYTKPEELIGSIYDGTDQQSLARDQNREGTENKNYQKVEKETGKKKDNYISS